MIVARALSVANFGLFSTLIAIVVILSKVVDFGVEPIVFREFAKNKKNFSLFNTALTLRFILFLVVLFFFNLVAGVLNFSSEEIILTNILFFTIVFSSKIVVIRELLATPFKANLKMHYPVSMAILDQLTLLLLVVLMYYIKAGLLYFIIVYTFSNLPGFILMFFFLHKKFNYKFKINLSNVEWLIKQSLPMFGFVILITIFLQMDLLFLKYYNGSVDAGIYSTALRLTMPLSIVPTAIITTVFPILVEKISSKISTDKLINFIFKILYASALVFAVVFMFKAKAIVTLVWGNNYAASALPTTILFWLQVFLFINFFAIFMLIAHNRQFYNFVYSAILVGINLVLDFILVPQYSFMGAAIAKLIAGITGFIFIIVILKKFKINFSLKATIFVVWSFLLIFVVWVIAILTSLLLYLILVPGIIIIITLLTRFFMKEELFIFFKLLHKEKLGKRILRFK